MELSKVSTKFGAPMGRHSHGAGGLDDVVFELEWVPLTDGAYDVGGAYWGGPDDLYCAIGTLDDEEVAVHYLRAADRDDAWAKLQPEMGYENCTLLPENGSLIHQTIEFLQDYKAGLSIDEEDQVEITADEIDLLQCILEDKGLT